MDETKLLERIEALENELKRTRAREEIQNLMAHYELLQNQKNMSLHPMDFAMDTPDVSVTIAARDPFVGPQTLLRHLRYSGIQGYHAHPLPLQPLH